MPELKMKYLFRVEDALTQEVLSSNFLTEQAAEARLPSLKKKNPAAFVNKVEQE
jgi:hypothetical protein